jgi:hypothetical protein
MMSIPLHDMFLAKESSNASGNSTPDDCYSSDIRPQPLPINDLLLQFTDLSYILTVIVTIPFLV